MIILLKRIQLNAFKCLLPFCQGARALESLIILLRCTQLGAF